MPQKQRNRPALRRHPIRKRAARYFVIRAGALKPGESSKFLLPISGIDEECFIINYRGTFHAYVNRCRHVPMAMDWVDNQFFAEDGRYLMCQTHCAYYEPETGECVAGPASACGKFLLRVPLETADGKIFAIPPAQDAENAI